MDLVPVPIEDLLRTTVGVRAASRLKGASLREIGRLGVAELVTTYRISQRAAEKLAAVNEIARRAAQTPLRRGQVFRCSREVADHFGPLLRDLRHEEVHIGILDARHALMKTLMISRGGPTGASVDPRQVFGPAMRHGASAVVMVHNHPAGRAQPSATDVELTRRLMEVSRVVGVALLDHIVIGDHEWVSMADKGLL